VLTKESAAEVKPTGTDTVCARYNQESDDPPSVMLPYAAKAPYCGSGTLLHPAFPIACYSMGSAQLSGRPKCCQLIWVHPFNPSSNPPFVITFTELASIVAERHHIANNPIRKVSKFVSTHDSQRNRENRAF
jgi:hypothetical protein